MAKYKVTSKRRKNEGNSDMDWRKAKRLARREREGLSNEPKPATGGRIGRPHKHVRKANRMGTISTKNLFTSESEADRTKFLDTQYLKYREKAAKRLDKKDMFSREAFQAAFEGEVAKGRSITGGGLLRRQMQDGLTDAQISNMWAAHQREFPGKYRSKNDFIASKGWKDIDVAAARMKKRLEAAGLDASDAIVYRHIYSPGM